MSAIFVSPLPFTTVAANENPVAPVAKANLDKPGLVWRSADLTSVYCIIDLGPSASYDTVALIGTNLRTTDTVQVRTGTTNTGIGAYGGTAQAAYAGTRPKTSTAKTILSIGLRAERYLRIDIVSTGNPDTYTRVQRIVVGKAVSTGGIDYNNEQGFEDRSNVIAGLGYTSYDQLDTIVTQKFSMGFIPSTSWRTEWHPLLQYSGNTRALLFVPYLEDSLTFQTDALFGRITSKASGKAVAFNTWAIDLQLAALAP